MAQSKSSTGKSKKGRQHVTNKEKYGRQFARTAVNKRNAWARHIANHPGDKKAIVDIGIAKEKIRSIR